MAIKEYELDLAHSRAKRLSDNLSTKVYIISGHDDDDDTVECYFIDENGITRVWEEVIAIYENGNLIES